ncbi:MAG: hypothetical protein IJS10_02705 [Alphaproteobacteria bacterium]|nr:hypothetical protein [Alphaproteobacteria bacterium]
MKNVKCLAVASVLLLSDASVMEIEAQEKVFIEIGQNRYYSEALNIKSPCIYDETLGKHVICPIRNLPTYESPSIKHLRETMAGIPFKPRELWGQPIKQQMIYLKGAILECSLTDIVAIYHDNLAKTTRQDYYAKVQSYPYSWELEEKFENEVWKIVRNDYELSEKEFKMSLRSLISPDDALYSAPLIVHFTNKLAPRYELHYTDKNFPTKVVKLPSEFELLIGKPDKGDVVYDFDKDEELKKKVHQSEKSSQISA